MTKGKSKSKAKAKSKKDETKLPKKVAGVKVPKAVRESGSLATLFNSALGREILADALIAGASPEAIAAQVAPIAGLDGAALARAATQNWQRIQDATAEG